MHNPSGRNQLAKQRKTGDEKRLSDKRSENRGELNGSASDATPLSDIQVSGVLNVQTLDYVPKGLRRDRPHGPSEPVVRSGATAIPRNDGAGRYVLDGEIARGGMGSIIRGRDTHLGRDLAIKVLRDSHKHRPEVIQRFVEEAQIGGQLQHPGIAPVYELGQLADGRPFFSMKLVRGVTLSEMLAKRRDPSSDRGRFVSIFEQICQTVAYAHSRGVIHRDLKPLNVMVGAFGEVQVMDWGLAKVLGDSVPDDVVDKAEKDSAARPVQTIRSSGSTPPEMSGSASSSDTLWGSILGTPAYMAPEQAQGEIDRTDERADVFSLGSILCEILTGAPPYPADDKVEAHRQASGGQLSGCMQRISNSGADATLQAIARDCLSVDAEKRPQDAAELADRVTGYLESVDSRLRRAEIAQVEATARAEEERKRQRVVLALAVSTLLTLGFGFSGWAAMERQRTQVEQQVSREMSTAAALGNIDFDVLPDPQSLARAHEALERAKHISEGQNIDADLRRHLNELESELAARQRDLQLQASLEAAWTEERAWFAEQERLRNPVKTAKGNGIVRPIVDLNDSKDFVDAATRYENAFAAWGIEPITTTEESAVARLDGLPESVRTAAIVSLDSWRQLLALPRTILQWEEQTWTTLRPVEFQSRGGDALTLQPDGSLLASGNNAYAGYELVYETDAHKIDALRLEAILDDSLPGGGPGRRVGAKQGGFHLRGLTVTCAPRSDPNARSQLHFGSVVASINHPVWPVNGETWNAGFGGGKPQAAVFLLDEPRVSESGFRIEISHTDWPRENMLSRETQNLGRFRWSAWSGDNDSVRTAEIQWLDRVLHATDSDEWREAMRAEMNSGDVEALIQRSKQPEADEQPIFVRLQLANWLRTVGARKVPEMFPRDIPWRILETAEVHSVRGSTLSFEDNGFVVASGENPGTDVIVVEAPVSDTRITAVRLEMVPHRTELSEMTTSRVSSGGHWVEIGDFSIGVETDTGEHKPLNVIAAVTDYDIEISVRAMIDGDKTTHCAFPDPHDPHSVTFLLEPPESREGGLIHARLTTGRGVGRNMHRFRLSVTQKSLPLLAPERAALALLERMHEKRPYDFWVRLALAETLLEQTPARKDHALSHATDAAALKSDRVLGHLAVLRCLPLSELEAGNAYGNLAVMHSQLARRLDDRVHDEISSLVKSLMEQCLRRIQEGRFQDAMRKYRLAASIDSEKVARSSHKMLRALAIDRKINRQTAAWIVELGHDVLEVTDEENWIYYDTVRCLGIAYYRLENYDLALAELKRAYELGDQAEALEWTFLAMTHWQLGNKDEARNWYSRAVDWHATRRADSEVKRAMEEAADLMGDTTRAESLQ